MEVPSILYRISLMHEGSIPGEKTRAFPREETSEACTCDVNLLGIIRWTNANDNHQILV